MRIKSNRVVSSASINRRVLWVVAASLLVLSGGVWWQRVGSRSPLPELAAHPQLPTRFNELLVAAHAAADTGDPAAVRRLARLYHANRLASEARACYAWLAARAGGLTAQDHYLLAHLALNAGDLTAAQAELRTVLQLDSTCLPARVNLAESLLKSGEEAAASAEYEAVLQRHPDQPQALAGLARLALQRGDDATAISRLERVLAVHPAMTSAAGLLAQVMIRRGERERGEALTEWSRRARDPLLPDPWLDALWADCHDVQRLTLRFEELVYSGQMEAALPLLERVGELDPQNWLPHLLRGWAHARAGRGAEAVAEYHRALGKSGDPERILALLVPALLAQDRTAEAVDTVETALLRRPDSVALLNFQADLAMRQGDTSRALALLTALLAKEPYLYNANMNLAQILWARGEKNEAVRCLTRVAKAFPVDVASRGLLGQFYLEKGDVAAAVLPLEQALPQAETGSPARERLSAMLVSALGRHAGELAQARQFRAAADALARLATLQPGNPTVEISLGDMLYQAGDPAAARPHWEKALVDAAPGDADLRQALQERLGGRITPETFQ
jgi:tetratricopeptide (TPR) repeat protein